MMDLVGVLVANREPMNLKRLATATGLHTSTAHRILAMMVSYRIVDRLEPGMYRLGIRWLELGRVVKSRINLRADALPIMRRLHFDVRETVNLCTRHGDDIVYVERAVNDRQSMRATQLIGTRAPLHTTAGGKVFLLNDGEDKCREYATRTRLPALTNNTIRNLEGMLEELEKIAKLGYAIDNEETEAGVSCIAAGIRDDQGELVAVLSVSAPTNRLQKSWGDAIQSTALQISQMIGYTTQS